MKGNVQALEDTQGTSSKAGAKNRKVDLQKPIKEWQAALGYYKGTIRSRLEETMNITPTDEDNRLERDQQTSEDSPENASRLVGDGASTEQAPSEKHELEKQEDTTHEI